MAKTVIGLFDTTTAAQAALQDALQQGFQREDVSVIALHRGEAAAADMLPGKHEGLATGASAGALLGGVAGLLVGLGVLAIPGIGPVLAAGPLATTLAGAGIGAATGSLIGALADMGVPEEEARLFEEGVRRGGTLVAVRTSDELAQQAAESLSRHGAADVIRRAGTWQAQRTDKGEAAAAAESPVELTPAMAGVKGGATAAASTPTGGGREASFVAVPVIEEEIAVGKREVDKGGVRIYTHVTERPVTESVQLREETVTVERRPVDRPASSEAIGAFKEGTIDVRARAEEAVVAKQARVVEEVVIKKDVAERTETIADTLRRTDVAVQPLPESGAAGPVRTEDFESFSDDFHRHYATTFASSGLPFTQFAPAYRYGYDLACDTRFRDRPWTTVESEAHRAWEAKNPGTWDRFKDAVRHAWQRTMGQGGGSSAAT